MEFTKMHGLGNDFVVIDCRRDKETNYYELAAKICDRHFGVGADGLMVVLPSEQADCRMRIFNSDGSEPEMCGNGLRCFARYVYEKGIVSTTEMTVETLAGIMKPKILFNQAGEITKVKVDMGEPILKRSLIPIIGDGEHAIKEKIVIDDQIFIITAISMGNPHCVIFTENAQTVDLTKWGPKIEHSAYFPQKTNVEFVQVLSPTEMRMRVWERGAAVTLACGTGACAALTAAVLNGLTERDATIHLDGGDLEISWSEDSNHIFMTGAAENVFEGVLSISR